MSSRSYKAQVIETTDPELLIEVTVRYAGKPSYVGDEAQGYWLSVVPVRIVESVMEGITYQTRRTAGYSGVKRFLEPATRYSERYMCNIVLPQEWIDEWVDSELYIMELERKVVMA